MRFPYFNINIRKQAFLGANKLILAGGDFNLIYSRKFKLAVTLEIFTPILYAKVIITSKNYFKNTKP